MLISEMVKVAFNPQGNKMKTYYASKGYEVEKVDGFNYFIVKVSDIPRTSREAIVDIKCDYCGKEYKASYYNYNRTHKHTNKDSCGDPQCNNSKRKETNMELYGTEGIPIVIKSKTVKTKTGEVVEMCECNVCKKEKPLTEFPKNNKSTIGVSGRCIDCGKVSDSAIRQREYRKKYNKEYADKHREERRAYRQKWWQKKYLEKKKLSE